MSTFDFKRLKRTQNIYRVVQVLLLAMLIGAAVVFQAKYGQIGKPDHFFKSLIFAIVAQLAMLYPMYRLAWRDAGVEVDSSYPGLTTEQLSALRKKRLLGDLLKMSLLLFFLIFVARSPDAGKVGSPFFQSTTLFAFLLIFLTYFQCFNYSIKKKLRDLETQTKR